MANAADILARHAALAGGTIADEVRRRLLASLDRLSPPEWLTEAEQVIQAVRPAIEQSIEETVHGGYILGAGHSFAHLPAVIAAGLTAAAAGAAVGWFGGSPPVTLPGVPPGPSFPPLPPVVPPTVPPAPPILPTPAPYGGPLIRLEVIDRAAKNLAERSVLTADDFYRLSAAAKQQAFTITADVTEAAIDKVRGLLAEATRDGPSLETWARAVREGVDFLPISESHLESIYRTNLAEAYAQGQERILEHPMVGDSFPYRMYWPIHDARARPEHRALETMGLDGTNVFYFRDPTWFRFRPPWSWQCRCGWSAVSVRDAATAGVREAILWRDTGIEPPHEHVTPPPFSPDPRWERSAVAV